jgi:hypothetical protein
MPDDHERAITTISEMLGGKAISRSFKIPYGSAKIILHGIERRYHSDETEVDETEDDKPTVRESAEQDQDQRNRPILDWSTHWNSRRQAPCTHCHQPAMLFDDAGRPAHKICAELALAALLGQSVEGSLVHPRAKFGNSGCGTLNTTEPAQTT